MKRVEINEELLSVVLGINDIVHVQKEGSCSILISRANNPAYIINIYELAHKCKEWAFSKGYIISSGLTPVLGVNKDGWAEVFSSSTPLDGKLHTFKQLSESEAVFKACEWILKEAKQ